MKTETDRKRYFTNFDDLTLIKLIEDDGFGKRATYTGKCSCGIKIEPHYNFKKNKWSGCATKKFSKETFFGCSQECLTRTFKKQSSKAFKECIQCGTVFPVQGQHGTKTKCSVLKKICPQCTLKKSAEKKTSTCAKSKIIERKHYFTRFDELTLKKSINRYDYYIGKCSCGTKIEPRYCKVSNIWINSATKKIQGKTFFGCSSECLESSFAYQTCTAFKRCVICNNLFPVQGKHGTETKSSVNKKYCSTCVTKKKNTKKLKKKLKKKLLKKSEKKLK